MNEKEIEKFYVCATLDGWYITKIGGSTETTVTLYTVYRLITGSFIPVPVSEVLVVPREDLFVLYELNGE